MIERIPPHSDEAERSVLGSVMLNKDVLFDVLEEVGFVIDTAEDGTIAVKKVRENGNAYDLVLMEI